MQHPIKFGEQISMFADLEQAEHNAVEQRIIDRMRREYLAWKSTPQYTPIDRGCESYNSTIYGGVAHVCGGMPEDVHVWRNVYAVFTGNDARDGREYWVLNHRGNPSGERIDVCPYCGANLRRGEGDVFLERNPGTFFADERNRRYWRLDELDGETEGNADAE